MNSECAKMPTCVFAHRNPTSSVCSKFLLVDDTKKRTDCDGRAGGNSGEFLMRNRER